MDSNHANIHFGNNMDVLKEMESGSVNLVYVDPPFNTGKIQSRKRIETVRSEDGDRIGFKGHTYKTRVLGEQSFFDIYDDCLLYTSDAADE